MTGWYDKFLEPSFSGTVFAPVDQVWGGGSRCPALHPNPVGVLLPACKCRCCCRRCCYSPGPPSNSTDHTQARMYGTFSCLTSLAPSNHTRTIPPPPRQAATHPSPPAPHRHPQGFDALLAKANATWDDMLSASMNDTLAAIVGLHVVPGPQPLFPLSDVRDGQPLATATGRDIYLRRE